MSIRSRTLHWIGAWLLLGLAVGCDQNKLPEDPAERQAAILARAWGPESPRTLERFLAVRAGLKPTFEENREALIQHSLREVSSRPLVLAAVKGLMQLREQADRLLAEQQLSFDDYLRLTALVYGRWLRSVREEEIPERRLTRMLQEMEVVVQRHLERAPPGIKKERETLESRLASIRHQLKWVSLYGLQDKAATLQRIDPATRAWLEQHRSEIEANSFDIFDTAAPERTKPPAANPPAPATTS